MIYTFPKPFPFFNELLDLIGFVISPSSSSTFEDIPNKAIKAIDKPSIGGNIVNGTPKKKATTPSQIR